VLRHRITLSFAAILKGRTVAGWRVVDDDEFRFIPDTVNHYYRRDHLKLLLLGEAHEFSLKLLPRLAFQHP